MKIIYKKHPLLLNGRFLCGYKIKIVKRNWTKFENYYESNTKAFEALCNQLFENWCNEECKETIKVFQVINGASGDGGFESFYNA